MLVSDIMLELHNTTVLFNDKRESSPRQGSTISLAPQPPRLVVTGLNLNEELEIITPNEHTSTERNSDK